ncbi:MAG: glycosyltransferase family 2 protein [Planctomycetota bacterium]|nr:glycosyltransferase family 2 protein [Planctomycetota bacterium]
MKPLASLTIVVLAYNEQESLPRVVEETRRAGADVAEKLEVIVVDDGSTDCTASIADSLAHESGGVVRALHHKKNLGIGAAETTGYRAARHEYITFFPADGQIPASSLTGMAAIAPQCDIVITKYRKRDSLRRRLLSMLWRDVLVGLMFGRVVMADGNYIFRRRLLDRLIVPVNTQAFHIGFFVRARMAGLKMRSVVIDCLPRLHGHSKVASTRSVVKILEDMRQVRNALAEIRRRSRRGEGFEEMR